MYTAAEVSAQYARIGAVKAAYSAGKQLALGVFAGLLIALAGAASSTAAHAVADTGIARLITGIVFGFGLGMVIVTGAELFTGNCLMVISVLDKKTSLLPMLKNWFWVYIGNFIGALIAAAGCVLVRQFNYSANGLAWYTVKIAAAKMDVTFGAAFVSGIFCNVLVCLGVFVALAGSDVISRLTGALLPVAFFVICGFEHCVADMFYVPAGIFALSVPSYAEAASGIGTASLTWAGFLRLLVPVTLGNIAGGALLGFLMWAVHRD
jgi:formate/nitrite transporter